MTYYEIKLVKKTVHFLKGVLKKTYKITKVISKCGVVQRVTIGFFTVVVALGLKFGSLTPAETTIQSQSQIERQLEHSRSTQPYKAMDGSKSPSVSNLLKLSGGEWHPKSGPGPRAKADARKAAANRAGNSKAGNSQSGVSPFAEAFTVEPKFPARPSRNRDGLFGRFTPQPTPDPHNPGCAGGPRSITVLSGQRNSDSSTNYSETVKFKDGYKAQVGNVELDHILVKHGHQWGIDDIDLKNTRDANNNLFPGKPEQIRTRLTPKNPEKSRKLSRFLIIIEENLHLRQKNKYIELLEIFLNNKINAEDFSFCFIAIYDDINQNLREMKQDFEKKFDELSNLLTENKNKKYQIGMSLMSMYDHCDDFDLNSNTSIIDEENLRNYAKMLLSELKRA